MRGNAYVFTFMAIICVACALIVSGTASVLRSQQEYAAKIDTYKNVLLAAGLIHRGESVAGDQIQKTYESAIKGMLVSPTREVVANETNLTPEDVLKVEKVLPGTPGYVEPDKRAFPIYKSEKDGKVDAWIVPIYGKGLWSDLFGYLSLEADGKTIRHIVFYKEGETPGLGKEITQAWFQDQFVGKTYLDPAGQISFTVGRPGKTPSDPTQVAGISGSTITSRAVQKLVMDMMDRYRPFFETNVWNKVKG